MKSSLLFAAIATLVVLVPACASPDSSDSPMPPAPQSDASAEQEGSAGSAGAAGTAGTSAGGSKNDAEAGTDAVQETLPEANKDSTSEDSGPEPVEAAPDSVPEAQSEEPPKAGCLTGTFQPFFGNLHAHTSSSDGEKEPADAFAYARDVGHLDILIVTDHLEQVMIPTRWADCKAEADNADQPGVFLAACGYEYATFSVPPISTGHYNIFFNQALMSPTDWDVKDVYASLDKCNNCLGQFNHPGDEASQTFNDFAFDPKVDDKLALFEFNGGGAVWDHFFSALTQGWHVSPGANQDNHSADWGTKDDKRTGFYLEKLDRPALFDAMRKRRSFMTTDKNADFHLLADQSCWMGSRLSGYGSVEISLIAQDKDPGDGFAVLELYGPNKTVLATINCQGKESCSGTTTIDSTQFKFVVGKAKQVDGNELVSAPIWFE